VDLPPAIACIAAPVAVVSLMRLVASAARSGVAVASSTLVMGRLEAALDLVALSAVLAAIYATALEQGVHILLSSITMSVATPILDISLERAVMRNPRMLERLIRSLEATLEDLRRRKAELEMRGRRLPPA